MTPLLELIQLYTGFEAISLIGATHHAGRLNFYHINVGKTKENVPKDLASFNEEAFIKMCTIFGQFVSAKVGEC